MEFTVRKIKYKGNKYYITFGNYCSNLGGYLLFTKGKALIVINSDLSSRDRKFQLHKLIKIRELKKNNVSRKVNCCFKSFDY